MKIIYLMLATLSFPVLAQDFLTQIQEVNQQVGQNEVDKYLKKPGKEGLPGPFIESLLPSSTAPAGEVCDEKVEPKKTHYEVILVAEQGTDKGSFEILPKQKAYFQTLRLQSLVNYIPEAPESKGLTSEAVLSRSKELWNGGWFDPPSKDFDPQHPIGRELFIESLVQAAAKSPLNEKDLSRQMANIISSTYKTKEDKFNALSAYSLRLYRNYNNARNPGYNNELTNPAGKAIPEGDMTHNQLVKAAADFEVYQGGVCNDISEMVAMTGAHLFPDLDVLTVNAGSHFGVVLTDGKEHRIIDGAKQMVQKQTLKLVPELSPTNLRISQVHNGALRQIAVVDTQLGQLTEAAFKTGKKLLKTDTDISSVVARFKKDEMNYAIAEGQLNDSQVVLVVAKYETSSDKFKAYAGVGASAQKFHSGQETKYQIHLRAGAERELFRYVNQNAELNVTSGVHGNFMFVLNPYDFKDEGYKADISGGIDWVNKVSVNFGKNNPDGVQIKGSVQTEHSFGAKNWGNTTGALSHMSPGDAGTMLKNVTFHLNQINAEVEVEKKIAKSVSGVVSSEYQGSNIGSRANILAGLKIKAPEGAQILVFTGYSNSQLKGYKTKHSLLAGPTGPEAGVKITTKKGIEFEAKVQRSVSGKPSAKATLTIPLTNNSGR